MDVRHHKCDTRPLVDKERRLRPFGKSGYLLWVNPHCERDFLNFLLQCVFTVCLMGIRWCIRFGKFYDHHNGTIVVVRKQCYEKVGETRGRCVMRWDNK
jgi:hypothetical protein